MKQWRETRLVLEELARLSARGEHAALATVVRVRGSAYRRPGARLLVAADGSSVGNVSGGCLEEDVREVALRVLATGRSELRSYCSGSDPIDAWDLGVGCEGEVEVYVRPVPPGEVELLPQLEGDEPFAFCTLCEAGTAAGDGLLLTGDAVSGSLGDPELDRLVVTGAPALDDPGTSELRDFGGRMVFVDRFLPPPQLFLFGAGEDARPLAVLAASAGFRVTVVDRRPGLLRADRFPGEVRRVHARAPLLADRLSFAGECFAVLMTHNFADDAAYLAALASQPLRYIGVLGPRARTERLLQLPGCSALADDPRLYGPVGLDVGTEGAEQVAVSIVAELLAVRAGRSALPLRERCLPIHFVGA